MAAIAKTGTAPSRAAKPAITVEYVEALKAYADVLYKGGLCPKPQKGESARSETVAAILEVGKDIGLPATQALANIRITNGRPAIFGDAGLALIRASGQLEDIEETFEGEPYQDGYTAVCRLKRKGAMRDKIERFSVADAKRAGLWGKDGPWQTAPKRMLMFRARGFACRDEFGDVMCGLIFVEEADDIPGHGGDAPRVAVPVQVQQVPPAALAAASEPMTTAPATLPAANPATATRAELINLLTDVRAHVLAAKGITESKSPEAKAAWMDALAPFNITTVRDLDDAKLKEVATALMEQHGPPF